MDVRERIRAAIARREGATVRNTSLAAGLSDSALHKFLTGQTRSITIESLEKIAMALDVSVRHLMFGDDDIENVTYLWDRISEQHKARALKVLETFADEDTEKRA